jgi:hypothetical protein
LDKGEKWRGREEGRRGTSSKMIIEAGVVQRLMVVMMMMAVL